MDIKLIRGKLKRCQPYFVEKDLLPKLYFKEDENDREYWVFKYAFIRRLSDISIAIRLGYSKQNIHYIIKSILTTNYHIITSFLATQDF